MAFGRRPVGRAAKTQNVMHSICLKKEVGMSIKTKLFLLFVLIVSVQVTMGQVDQKEELNRMFRGQIIKGDIEAVKTLIKEGVDINNEFWISGTGLTPVLLAARVGRVEILEYLINNGGDLSACPDGLNALHTAVSFGDDEIAKAMTEILVLKGMDVNAKSNDYKLGDETPLHIAARCGNLKTADLLLKHGANVNTSLIRKYYAYTPLILASKGKYDKVVNLLIQNGADINAQDSRLRTPLHYAVMNNDTAVVDILLTNGADLAIKDYNGWTPVSDKADYRGSQEIKALFRKYGIDLK